MTIGTQAFTINQNSGALYCMQEGQALLPLVIHRLQHNLLILT
jgi:hypothetical protein